VAFETVCAIAGEAVQLRRTRLAARDAGEPCVSVERLRIAPPEDEPEKS